MDWLLLGIEPTKDKKAITNAYRQKLRQTNPEDKPEAFKALRQAYEEALALAEQEETAPVRDESPVGRWMEAVEAVYQNYPSRIDPEKWKGLLSSDVCVGLDTRPAAEEALLRFLMEHYFIPRAVWQVLDDGFRFSERVEELYETWPRDFIDHALMSGLRLEPALDHYLFTPGTNGNECDALRSLYFQANHTPLEEIGPILEQMDKLSERHPYGDVLRFRHDLATGREEEGRAGFRRLAQAYPDHPELPMFWADICLDAGDVEEAERIAHHVMELHPDQIGAQICYARCIAARGEYQQAKERVYEIMNRSGSDPILMDGLASQLKKWNEDLIVQRQEQYREHPEDTDNAIELAWCYAQNERLEEAMELAKAIDPANAGAFEYHNLVGKLHLNLERFEEALVHLEQAERALRTMKPDGTEKTEKQLRRLPGMCQTVGSCLAKLGRNAEAREKLEEALAMKPEDEETLAMMGRILYASGDYVYAVEILERQLRRNPGAWFAELLLAMAQYKLRRDREAFDAINRALAIQGTDLSLYVLKMLILARNGAFGEVHATLDYLKESGAPEHITVDYVRAVLTELEQKDTESALKQYQQIAKQVEGGTQLLWEPELYYRMAVLTGNRLDVSREENRNRVLALVDKGLEYDGQDADLLTYKAWVLKQSGLYEDAVAMYRELLERNPDSVAALRGLAELYYEDLELHGAEALECYEKLLSRQKTAELYFYAATCKRHLGDRKGARNDHLRELEMDPDDMDGYRGLAFLAEWEGDHDRALEYIDQGLSIMESMGRCYDWMVEHKAKLLRRQGRWEAALAFVDEAVKRYQFAGANQMKFDICCQFGQWDRAKQILDRWKQDNRNDPELMAATARLHLLTGRLFKAAVAMGPAKHKLGYERIQDFRLQLAELECNHSRRIEIWSRRAKQNPGDDYALTSLAQAYWNAGKTDFARGAAQKALKLLDEAIPHHHTDEALLRGRRSVLLAILGRAEEAKAELARTRKLPLCEFCEYGSCKDADIYEAAIEEILGNADSARRLYQAGKNKWPDDLDFAAGEARLSRKGKKKC